MKLKHSIESHLRSQGTQCDANGASSGKVYREDARLTLTSSITDSGAYWMLIDQTSRSHDRSSLVNQSQINDQIKEEDEHSG